MIRVYTLVYALLAITLQANASDNIVEAIHGTDPSHDVMGTALTCECEGRRGGNPEVSVYSTYQQGFQGWVYLLPRDQWQPTIADSPILKVDGPGCWSVPWGYFVLHNVKLSNLSYVRAGSCRHDNAPSCGGLLP